MHTLVIRPEPAPLFAHGWARRLIRFTAGLANPALQRLVRKGWIPFFGVVLHRGRSTGRAFATPVGLGMAGGRFMIPLTFGDHSHWYRNVEAAGGCTLVWRGAEHAALRPIVVEAADAREAFPAALWFLLRLLRIDRFLSLQPA